MAIALPVSHAPSMESSINIVSSPHLLTTTTVNPQSVQIQGSEQLLAHSNSPVLSLINLQQHSIKYPFIFGADTSSVAIAVDSLNPPKKPRKPRKTTARKATTKINTGVQNKLSATLPQELDMLNEKYHWIQMPDGNSYLVSNSMLSLSSTFMSPPNSPSLNNIRPTSPAPSVSSSVPSGDIDFGDLPGGTHSEDENHSLPEVKQEILEAPLVKKNVPKQNKRKRSRRIRVEGVKRRAKPQAKKATEKDAHVPPSIFVSLPFANGNDVLAGDLFLDVMNIVNSNSEEDEAKVLRREMDPYLIPPSSASSSDIQNVNWEKQVDYNDSNSEKVSLQYPDSWKVCESPEEEGDAVENDCIDSEDYEELFQLFMKS